MNFLTAWHLYQTHYTPEKIGITENMHVYPQKSMINISNLSVVADEFEVLLLDGFGVLNIGESAVPNMPETLTHLKQQGKAVFVLTNGGSRSRDVIAEKYPRLGYEIETTHVISSRDALVEYLQTQTWTQSKTWGVISMQDYAPELLPVSQIFLDPTDSSEQAMQAVDGFLFLGSGTWNKNRQACLESALREYPRPVLVANPDMCAPWETSFSVEPGCYATELASIAGVEVLLFGKPFQAVYDLAYSHICHTLGRNVARDQIVMVGDTLHTDIIGGNAAGMKTALMTKWGFFRDQAVLSYLEEAGIYPDYCITT